MSELVLQTVRHSRGLWLAVRVRVARQADVQFVVDTGSLGNGLSQAAYDDLSRRGLRRQVGKGFYLLDELEADGQALPVIRVYVSKRATQVGADALLGLDFLMRYTDIHFHVPTMRLTLRAE